MGCPNNVCNTVLDLGLSLESNPQNNSSIVPNKPRLLVNKQGSCLNFEPSLSLGLCGGSSSGNKRLDVKKVSEEYSELSGVSSFSVKRERDVISDEDDRVSSRIISDEDDLFDANSNATRKKLRLTKEQSALLEDSFKQHSTLNPKQKQALARQLNLRPRQVEVWFQNRRARTKLKQTEVDCEFLKKCCETLTDENRRLQKEVDELKALKMAQPFYMQMPAATLTMCPSCERINGININDSANSKNININPFSMAPKPFYNPFTNPSAAC